MLSRVIVGFALAVIVAIAARRLRWLTASGAVAAVVVGTVALAAGWSWGVILILYFATSSALSHMDRGEKERATASLVAKTGERDAAQVLSNGAVFAAGALATIIYPAPHWAALGLGALASSAADTWATEVGTVYGFRPRSILNFRRVPRGTSGGISFVGTLAAVGGASFIGMVAHIGGWDSPVTNAAVIAGIAGAFIDSLIGATLQSRRWCESCRSETERTVHSCGNETRPLRGLAWLDNDLVNFVSNLLAGLLAAYIAR